MQCCCDPFSYSADDTVLLVFTESSVWHSEISRRGAFIWQNHTIISYNIYEAILLYIQKNIYSICFKFITTAPDTSELLLSIELYHIVSKYNLCYTKLLGKLAQFLRYGFKYLLVPVPPHQKMVSMSHAQDEIYEFIYMRLVQRRSNALCLILNVSSALFVFGLTFWV